MGHLRGDWLYISDLDEMNATGNLTAADGKRWIPLVKPHSLGPWRQQETPDPQSTEDALAVVRSAGVPRLFAVLERSPEDGYWSETSRVFVVPSTWPGVPDQR